MTQDPLRVIRKGLQAYADRGIFRGFSEDDFKHARASFSFQWMTPRRLQFTVDASKGVLTFKHLLPNIETGSIIYKDLKRFLLARYDNSLPRHRRIDKKRAEIVCTNRQGAISLSL